MEGYRLFGVILLNKEPNLMFERIENFEIWENENADAVGSLFN